MRFVGSGLGEFEATDATVEPLKTAIPAALIIADEFSRYRKERSNAVGIWIEKTEEMSERLGKIIT